MPEEKSCLNCNKDDNLTGNPCPTRAGCHFPNYDNWEAIFKDDSSTDLMNLEARYKKEKGQPAEWNQKGYTLQYVWWLEHKVLALEKQIDSITTDE